ncbi:NAD(P)(+) transhydrogenase (Re/Si-specific) subunit alpha, partial [Haloechinothrix sp. YIM 98757]|nr:NAD(P)(+) transhydrogenase (Re/Si-specific) subunit alpha [Haloechinothrix aidingensis]
MALVPGMVERLARRGVGVIVASGAGVGAFVSDEAFVAAGARVGDPWEADVVACVRAPGEAEVARARPGTVVVGFL